MNTPMEGILGESSPKRRIVRRSLKSSMVEKSTTNTATNHLDLGEYHLGKPEESPRSVAKEDEWEDEEVYSIGRLSPIGTEMNELPKLEKVSSYTPHSKITTANDTIQGKFETRLESNISHNSDADDTILKVKQFIEGKRKDLNNKRKSLSPQKKEHVEGPNIPKLKDTERKQKINLKASKQRKHRKTLQRLIRKIHEEPYDSQWSIVEWQLFQHYLNEWKLSGDDNMFNDEVLKDLFNCSVEELEVRIKSLKKLVDYKRKIKKVCN